MVSSKTVYKPVSLVVGTVGGMVAGMVFKQVWRLVRHEDHAPSPMDEERGWREIIVAAAIQGAIYAAVKATVNRGGARAVHRVTGTWPA